MLKLANDVRKEVKKMISLYRKDVSWANPYGKKVKNYM